MCLKYADFTHTQQIQRQLMIFENMILRVKKKGHFCYFYIYSFNRYLSSVKDFIPRGFQWVADNKRGRNAIQTAIS